MAFILNLVLLLSSIGAVLAVDLCPIYGPVFPPTEDLLASSTWQTASTQIKAALDDAFSSGNTSHGPVSPNNTFSIQIFSTKDTLFEYHHEGSDLATSGGHGSEVDGDSVYRVGSVSKLYAVYLLLVVAGDRVFSDPMTKYIPELKGIASWDEVSVGALAGQIGGVVADLFDVDSITGGGLGAQFPGVFPELTENETSLCIANVTHCTRSEFLTTLLKTRSTYLPNTTPGYSNSAFVLIGYIIETITNTSFASALETHLLQPLGLRRTFASIPEDSSIGAIIKNATVSGWDIDLSEATAEGGIFASASDVSALGRSILSSKLLSPNTTRAWLKPTSFTSSTIGFVGRPWEIYRSVINEKQNRVVDIYTKGGNIGVYASTVALIPDFDVGFTILIASETGAYPYTLSGVLTDALLPAVEEAARLQTDKAYAGTYRAASINSSVTISSEKGKPGLTLDSWVSNGTDVFGIFGSPEDFRIYPSNVGYQQSQGNYSVMDGERVSWKAVSGVDLGYEDHGAFSACPTWLQIDRPSWGLYGIDDWVFVLGEDGRVKQVEIAALKIVLERVEG
ncbi:uncharacterized protein N0V89_012544 [Didymosphaeria variabile]|uniref:Beta-lactamase/transpeptidase-like protein n=1 Tax=Didymosphaeria variabile TaxID=1932322 RepID=A0A9W8XAU8_9PLEO|nr:uncharacterized protein N0V89_012544 [Didymosphaeria variabile]KAJ4344800.1 hypothetical protein N0V89_012544 [Didymosphaeria variabile]